MVGVCLDRPVFEPADVGLLFTLPSNRWYRAMVNVAGTLVLLAIVSLAVSFTAGPLAPFLGLAVGYVPFFLIYRFIPRFHIRGSWARIGALVSAVLWELAKIAFGFVTRSLGIFSVYGPIAFGAAMLTWIYVTAVIILIGAEVIKLKRAEHGTA